MMDEEDVWAEDEDIDLIFPDLPFDPHIELPPLKKMITVSSLSTQQSTQYMNNF